MATELLNAKTCLAQTASRLFIAHAMALSWEIRLLSDPVLCTHCQASSPGNDILALDRHWPDLAWLCCVCSYPAAVSELLETLVRTSAETSGLRIWDHSNEVCVNAVNLETKPVSAMKYVDTVS